MMKITLWSNGPACVQCSATKREFDRRGIVYTERDLRRNPKAVARFLEMGLTAAPIVETDRKQWSGFRLEKIKSLEYHLKNERRQGINVPLEPIKQVADEVDDEPTPEEIVATVKQVRREMAAERAKGGQK